jgi:hypothetical protein
MSGSTGSPSISALLPGDLVQQGGQRPIDDLGGITVRDGRSRVRCRGCDGKWIFMARVTTCLGGHLSIAQERAGRAHAHWDRFAAHRVRVERD